jgi:hypothetical protein
VNEAEVILAGLDARAPVALRRGVFVGMDAQFAALVDVGSSRFSCEFGAGYVPMPNEAVTVLTVGPRHLLLPQGAKPGEGVVASVTAPYAVVTTDIGDIKMPYVGSAPSAGQPVAIGWSNGPRVLGVLSALSTADEAPSAPPAGGLKTVTFYATQAGSTDRGAPRWWTEQPWASNSTYGFWFYGTQLRDTIPSGATFVSLQMFISRVQDQGGDPRFVLHNGVSKAGGIPSVSAYTEWDPAPGWQTPPGASSWFAALKGGGSQRGIGLNQGGFNKFSSLAQYRASGALKISWRQ